MSENKRSMDDLKVDLNSLYREEVFTDLQLATIRRHTPVLADGTVDKKRDVLYTGQTSLMTEVGTIPLNFEIDATDIGDAFAKFPEGMKKAYEEMVAEMQRMRREQASRIVAPPAGGLSGLGGAAAPAPGKRIQFP